MRLVRGSGVLIHPTSLPGRFGIGDLGPEAEKFVDFLTATGQRWWQMLPVGPTGFGNSPYQSHSSYAGNPLLISPDRLLEHGFLEASDLEDYPELSPSLVDFDTVAEAKETLLRRAFARWKEEGDPEFEAFSVLSHNWLDDYCLYMAIKAAHGGLAWNEWEPAIARRNHEALDDWRIKVDDDVRYRRFVQYCFHRQWEALRRYCHARSLRLIGDVPIFVSQDSADVWARPDLFELDDRGRPLAVAGVPPDYFSADGQLWGNPLYRWGAHAAEGFAWWIARLKATTDRVDLVRLDHFRGFQAYWEVPADAPTAVSGRWALAPGHAFLTALRAGLGGLPLIAEDLGQITKEVEMLRDQFNLPGMRILQFAFGDDPLADVYLPYNYINHCVVYTGTHDNDTTVGWFTVSASATTQSHDLIAAERAFVLRFLGTTGEEIHWDLIRLAFSSVADTVIIPLQDVMGLDSTARMNTPGRALGNWGWRFLAEQLDNTIEHRLADLTAVYDRWNGAVPAAYRSPRRPKTEELIMTSDIPPGLP